MTRELSPREEAQVRADEIHRLGLDGQMFVTMSWGCEYCNSFDVEPQILEKETDVNVSDIVKLALSLIGKSDQITEIVTDALALFKKVQAVLPDLTKQLESATGAGTSTALDTKWLQTSLNKLVNAGLTVDGSYGKATQDAVKKFQSAHGLTADGWAGAQTQAAILDALK